MAVPGQRHEDVAGYQEQYGVKGIHAEKAAAIASLSLEGGSNEIVSSSISLNGDGPIYRGN